MNYVWPNVFEISPHLIQATFDAVDGFRTSLGCSPVLQYLLQGLWHPARRVSGQEGGWVSLILLVMVQVREVYWRLYNNVYIGQQDALIACYPRLPEDAPGWVRKG